MWSAAPTLREGFRAPVAARCRVAVRDTVVLVNVRSAAGTGEFEPRPGRDADPAAIPTTAAIAGTTKRDPGADTDGRVAARQQEATELAELVRRSLSRFRLPYLTVTPTFSICPSHGYLAGEHPTCPQCEATCEVWTRVMGYHRPVSSFNIGKKGEHMERTPFLEKALVR